MSGEEEKPRQHFRNYSVHGKIFIPDPIEGGLKPDPKADPLFWEVDHIRPVDPLRTEAMSQEERREALKGSVFVDAVKRLTAVVEEADLTAMKRTQGLDLGYLDWIMRPTDAADARANLEEAFEGWVARHGLIQAQRIFKVQGMRLAAGYVMDRLTTRLGQVAKLLRFGF
jgi:hypothetical protein